MNEMLEVVCPHCQGSVWVEQLNCKIFRHGVFKGTGKQIPPHASKADCDKWQEQNAIWGCGKPFQIDDTGKAIVCEYI